MGKDIRPPYSASSVDGKQREIAVHIWNQSKSLAMIPIPRQVVPSLWSGFNQSKHTDTSVSIFLGGGDFVFVPTVVSPERRYCVLCFKPFFPGLGSIKVKKQPSVGEHLNLLRTHTLDRYCLDLAPDCLFAKAIGGQLWLSGPLPVQGKGGPVRYLKSVKTCLVLFPPPPLSFFQKYLPRNLGLVWDLRLAITPFVDR